MSFNGSGTYSAPASSWNPSVAGTEADEVDWTALLADITTALSTAICKDGQTTATARVPFVLGIDLTGAASPLKGSSFAAYLSSSTANTVTGDGTAYPIVCDTEDHDTLANFAAGVFTAPVTGKYLFTWTVHVTNLGAGHTSGWASLVTSDGRTFVGTDTNPYGGREQTSGLGQFGTTMTAVVSLTAAQTVTPKITINGSTKTAGVTSTAIGGTDRATRFSGHLIVG